MGLAGCRSRPAAQDVDSDEPPEPAEPAATELPQTPPSPRIVELSLSPGSAAGKKTPVAPLRTGTDEVRFELALEKPPADRYKARLLSASGALVWEKDDLRPGRGAVLVLNV